MTVDLEVISLEKQFVDGTAIATIETNVHKYSFVWKKALEKKERLQSKIDAVLTKISQAIESDTTKTDNQIHPKIDSQKLQEKIIEINQTSKKNLSKQ